MSNNSADVLAALRQLASKLAADQHYLQAIKAYTAILSLSLLPTDEATTRLRLAQLLLDHTFNLKQAKQQLQQAVSDAFDVQLEFSKVATGSCTVLAYCAWKLPTMPSPDQVAQCSTAHLCSCRRVLPRLAASMLSNVKRTMHQDVEIPY
jgi:hypothetical protein